MVSNLNTHVNNVLTLIDAMKGVNATVDYDQIVTDALKRHGGRIGTSPLDDLPDPMDRGPLKSKWNWEKAGSPDNICDYPFSNDWIQWSTWVPLVDIYTDNGPGFILYRPREYGPRPSVKVSSGRDGDTTHAIYAYTR